jgi:ABC-type enterochelin transport system substrate-binding protein
LSEELRRSLTGQIEILQQRLDKRREAKEKLAFLDAELTRIQEQVELVREQAVVSTDPETLSKRIDEVTATLGGTTQWISDQQKIYGAVEDLMSEPPPLQLQITNDE